MSRPPRDPGGRLRYRTHIWSSSGPSRGATWQFPTRAETSIAGAVSTSATQGAWSVTTRSTSAHKLRAAEPRYAELGLADASDDELVDAMTRYPELIERPVVIWADRAVVARPPELLLPLLESGAGWVVGGGAAQSP